MSEREEPDTEPEADEPKQFWHNRRWQLSAAFVAVAVCIGTVAMIWDATGGSSAAGPTGPTIGQLGPDGSRPQGCRTDDSDQKIPTAPPPGITWRPLNGADIPLSTTAGPLKTTGPLLWCFAHTPMGAVMAANIIPRHMSGPDWKDVLREQLVPGMPRDYFEAMRGSLEDEGEVRTNNRMVGFQIMKYTPRTAVVRLLIRQGTVMHGAVDYTVDWDGVDWKLRPLSVGGLYTEVLPVLSLVDFVLWREA